MDDNGQDQERYETDEMSGRMFGANYALYRATVAQLQRLEELIECPPELKEPFSNWAEFFSRVVGDGGEDDRADFVRRATYGIGEYWDLDKLVFVASFLDSAVKTWKDVRLAG